MAFKLIYIPPPSIRHMGSRDRLTYMMYVLRKDLFKSLCKLIALILGPDFYMLEYNYKKIIVRYIPKILNMGLNLIHTSKSFSINYQYEYNSNSELFKRYPKNIRVRP